MRNPANRMSDGISSARCGACRLVQRDCLCHMVPRIPTRTRVVLVMHQLEDRKTSNTGRLAHRCLPNSEIVIRGDPERSRHAQETRLAARAGLPPPSLVTPRLPAPDNAGAAPRDWTLHGDPVLLFPHPDARPLESWRDHPRPLTLIVPDGTWTQGQRVRHRTPGLASIPCATIARIAPSNYRLRRTVDPARLATLEAIAEALGVLEGEGPRQALLEIFDVMVERALRARTGGTKRP
ncbi:MAG TPA: tRNA-uridine aminocarboxypropyltransferase [Polyangia bacterium]|jgi:DTW domain-containing protein YfiP